MPCKNRRCEDVISSDSLRVPGAISPHPTTYHPLLTSSSSLGHVHLIAGNNTLASVRCRKSIEAGAKVVVVAPAEESAIYVGGLHPGLISLVGEDKISWVNKKLQQEDLVALGRPEVDNVVDLVWGTSGVEDHDSQISAWCKRLRIPVNIIDRPALCTFTLLTTYSDGPLHVGITTSGNCCKLGSRIRREIVSALPKGIGSVCERIGALRRMLRVQDVDNSEMGGDGPREVTIEDEDNEDESDQRSSFNSLVTSDSKDSAKTRRIRWLTQICEYWPLEKLCALTDADIEDILDEYKTPPRYPSDFIPSSLRKGRISLVGSGPGHPSLLTLEAMTAIKSAEVILADKLVSAEVLALIPRRTSVFIAKKFPGNADPAQEELLSLGIAALRAGKYVVRLKQGDPYIYGRGAEEFDAYSASGFPPSVIPGITSALSAPLFAEIPGTHRGVADQVLICTGTGRKGAPPDPPAWVETRTTIFLMALHRVAALINELASKGWPMDVPCAVVERASCSDQRVIRTRLGEVVGAVEALGSRPPGLLVVGRACTVLKGQEMATKWSVEEGFMGFVDRESIF